MTDPESTEQATAPPAAAPADFRSLAALRRSASRATLGLAVYSLVAVGLLAWSLLRGRLSDAVLLLVAMLVALPSIISYRKQVLQRLQAITSGEEAVAETGDGKPPGDVAGEGIDRVTEGNAPPSPSAES